MGHHANAYYLCTLDSGGEADRTIDPALFRQYHMQYFEDIEANVVRGKPHIILPFTYDWLNAVSPGDNRVAIDAVKSELAALRQYTGVVEPDAAWAGEVGDEIHFTAVEQRLIGAAAYTAYTEALANHSWANGYSNPDDMTHADWQLARFSAGVEEGTDPLGNTAWKFLETAVTNTHALLQTSRSFTSGNRYYQRLAVQGISRDDFRIDFPSTQFGSNTNVVFNLSGGTVTLAGSADVGYVVDLGRRCGMKLSPELTAPAPAPARYSCTARDGANHSYAGDAAKGYYMANPRLDIGA